MKNLKVESRDKVLWVQLARPGKRNAFHPEMIGELTTVFSKVKDRAVVLSGAGDSFCSGGDLDWMKSMAEYSLEENRQDSQDLFAMYAAIRDCPVPVIGRVHGHAMGREAPDCAQFATLSCAETSTKFSFSEVKWGLAPAVISLLCLRGRVQPHRAQEWMLDCESLHRSCCCRSGGSAHFSGNLKEIDAYVEQTLAHIKERSA